MNPPSEDVRVETSRDVKSLHASGALLAVEHLAVNYDQVPALRDVSLYVDEGEFVVLLGPNGAGKTTEIGRAHV